ncbi:DNA alkylation repair protein [Oceaniserpentilla sp. 4NH20-0058]|uniref:DNA alkylation repair protein n=1 Tax=Oceaniserpentilla sp. 4NH20-0058 TaxID=3127660 RepID=UPI003103A08D
MELMKNGLGLPAVKRISDALAKTAALEKSFDEAAFIQAATGPLESLELKQRVQHLIKVLHEFLPAGFEQAVECLLQLPCVWDAGDPDDPLRGFAAWPIIDYIAEHGVDHPQLALPALRELTHMFSAEFAIRPFLLAHPELCHAHFEAWVQDESEHVRRLVSEGTRPRLPWGIQLKPYVKDPTDNLPWLEVLKDDASLYVRRSVANHLNDISKDHPQLVLDHCKAWYPNSNEHVKWVIKHATRTLVKAGHPEVFELLGHTKEVQVKNLELKLAADNLVLGDSLEFELSLMSAGTEPQSLVVDFALHFMKANGSTSPKVFKWKTLNLSAGQSVNLQKKHAIKAITTRKYYSGTQMLEVLINGQPVAQASFFLQV